MIYFLSDSHLYLLLSANIFPPLEKHEQQLQMVVNCPTVLSRQKEEIMLFSNTSDQLALLTVPSNFGHYREYRIMKTILDFDMLCAHP